MLHLAACMHAAGKTLLHACSKTEHLQQPVVGCAEAERLYRGTTMLQGIIVIHAVPFTQSLKP